MYESETEYIQHVALEYSSNLLKVQNLDLPAIVFATNHFEQSIMCDPWRVEVVINRRVLDIGFD